MIRAGMRAMWGRVAAGGRRVRAQRAGRRGTATVEFSLVAPVLLIMIFGIIEFALAVHTQVDYGNAVTAGIRETTVQGSNGTDDTVIASKLFQTMRQDDPDRANYFSIRLIAGRYFKHVDLDGDATCQTTNGDLTVETCPDTTDGDNNTQLVDTDNQGAGTTDAFTYYSDRDNDGDMNQDTGTGGVVTDASFLADYGGDLDLNNLYMNLYVYNTITHQFETTPFFDSIDLTTYPNANPNPTNQMLHDFFFSSLTDAAAGGGPSNTTDYCAYFYQSHIGLDGKVYLDTNETIRIGPDPVNDPNANAQAFLNFLSTSAKTAAGTSDPAENLVAGCGRDLSATPKPVLTCKAQGQYYPFLANLGLPPSGHLCYYYPNQRVNSIDTTAGASGIDTLPDLVEVRVNYTYKPFGDYVTAHSPLGLGFTINETARGRLEPATKNQ